MFVRAASGDTPEIICIPRHTSNSGYGSRVTGRHRGGRSLRRRLVVAVLAAALGRGYVGRHRLAEAALGREPGSLSSETVVVPARMPVREDAAAVVAREPAPAPVVVSQSDEPVPAGRSSVAPWLRVVPTPPQPDQLADTLPHPVVTLFPLASPVPAPIPVVDSPESADTAEQQVFAALDAEREQSVTIDLAAVADVREYRARHTA